MTRNRSRGAHRPPVNPLIRLPRGGSSRERFATNQLDLNGNLSRPRFRFDHVGEGSRTVSIRADNSTPSTVAQLVVPHVQYLDDWDAPVTRMVVADEAQIDLDTSGLGGRVDGVSLAADTTYLLWHFLDRPGGESAGFGVTALPRDASAARSSGGTRGSSMVLTVDSGLGFRFEIGARVIVRAGTGTTSNYNQGTVTAHTNTSITLDMDAAYSGVSAASANDNLGAGNYEVYQLDTFAPRTDSTSAATLYEDYPYTLLGTIHTDGSSNIVHTRRRGEWYLFSSVRWQDSTSTSMAAQEDCLARWIPWHAHITGHRLILLSAAAAGANLWLVGNTLNRSQASVSLETTSGQGNAEAIVTTSPVLNSVRHESFLAGSTRHVADMWGYVEEAM